MHSEFPEWLRKARPKLDNETVLARVAAVESASKELSRGQVLDLAQFALTDLPPPAFFPEALVKADAAFPVRDSAEEVRILAVSTLVEIMAGREIGDLAALAIVCSSAAGLRTLGPIPEVLPIAERHLFVRGRDVRQVKEPREIAMPDLKKSVGDLTSVLAGANQPAFVQLGEFMPKLVSAQSALTESANGAIRDLVQSTRALREQLDIVWWVFGGRLSSGRQFAEVKIPELVFLAASELAQLTAFVPGPVSARGYIASVLQHGRKKLAETSIQEAVEAASPDWLSNFSRRMSTASQEYLCPTSTSLYRRATGGLHWKDGLDIQMALDTTRSLPPDRLSYQLYSEQLLLREAADQE